MSEIKGIKSLMNKLTALNVNTDKVLIKIIDNCGKFVADDARLNVPVDTSDLKKSIQHETALQNGVVRSVVSTNSDHAAYVEFGTGLVGEATNTNNSISLAYNQDWVGMSAQPYLYPALKDNEPQLKKYIADHLVKEIKKVVK